jgi:hypothetical protein
LLLKIVTKTFLQKCKNHVSNRVLIFAAVGLDALQQSWLFIRLDFKAIRFPITEGIKYLRRIEQNYFSFLAEDPRKVNSMQ